MTDPQHAQIFIDITLANAADKSLMIMKTQYYKYTDKYNVQYLNKSCSSVIIYHKCYCYCEKKQSKTHLFDLKRLMMDMVQGFNFVNVVKWD